MQWPFFQQRVFSQVTHSHQQCASKDLNKPVVLLALLIIEQLHFDNTLVFQATISLMDREWAQTCYFNKLDINKILLD